MIKLNRETDYGVSILALMAKDPQARHSAASLAEVRGLPQPIVSKILKHLARSDLVVSYRGAKGGYGLARPADEISVAEIITVLEGPIALTDCIEDGRGACQYGSQCNISNVWGRINDVVLRALSEITLAETATEQNGGGQNPIHTLEFTGVRHVREH